MEFETLKAKKETEQGLRDWQLELQQERDEKELCRRKKNYV